MAYETMLDTQFMIEHKLRELMHEMIALKRNAFKQLSIKYDISKEELHERLSLIIKEAKEENDQDNG